MGEGYLWDWMHFFPSKGLIKLMLMARKGRAKLREYSCLGITTTVSGANMWAKWLHHPYHLVGNGDARKKP